MKIIIYIYIYIMSQTCAINDATKERLKRFNVDEPAGGWENLDRSYLQKTIRYLESLNDKSHPKSVNTVSSAGGWDLAARAIKSERDAIGYYAYNSSSDPDDLRRVGVTQYTKLMRTLQDRDLPIRLKQIKAENKRYLSLAKKYPNIGEDIRDVVTRIEQDFTKFSDKDNEYLQRELTIEYPVAPTSMIVISLPDKEIIRKKQNYKINLLKTLQRLSIPTEEEPFYTNAAALKQIRAVKNPLKYILPAVDDLFKESTYNKSEFIRIGLI